MLMKMHFVLFFFKTLATFADSHYLDVHFVPIMNFVTVPFYFYVELNSVFMLFKIFDNIDRGCFTDTGDAKTWFILEIELAATNLVILIIYLL